eukprot:scaffold109579_cov26-Tisochrysis_lutea.AAC.4
MVCPARTFRCFTRCFAGRPLLVSLGEESADPGAVSSAESDSLRAESPERSLLTREHPADPQACDRVEAGGSGRPPLGSTDTARLCSAETARLCSAETARLCSAETGKGSPSWCAEPQNHIGNGPVGSREGGGGRAGVRQRQCGPPLAPRLAPGLSRPRTQWESRPQFPPFSPPFALPPRTLAPPPLLCWRAPPLSLP